MIPYIICTQYTIYKRAASISGLKKNSHSGTIKNHSADVYSRAATA
jgi:hypothetical protein